MKKNKLLIYSIIQGAVGVLLIRECLSFFFHPETLSYLEIVISGILILLLGLKYFLQGLIGLVRYLKTKAEQ